MENRNYTVKTALMITAGMGLVYICTRYKNSILNKWQQLTNLSDPLRHRQIQLIEQLEQCAKVVKTLKIHCAECPVLGFDCEWVTVGGKRRSVSLLQLSSHRGLCALFRLNCLKQIPTDLRELLEDEDIIKVGVAAYDDANKLSYDYGVDTLSTFDLRYLAALVGHKAEGLAGLAKSLLQVELDKNWRLACSDWEAKQLSKKQLLYAANDALVGIEVFKKLAKRLNNNVIWKSPNSAIVELLRKIEQYYDMRFTPSFQKMPNSNEKLECKEKINITQKRSLCTMKKPLYDNCVLEAPDGEVLATINRRKAQWYLYQELGEVIPDAKKLKIRLKFQPAGRAMDDERLYYTQEKINRCVVCGRNDVYSRKNIVPREYRKHFPLKMKSHTSHDVLLLCPECHMKSNKYDLNIRVLLAKKCDAPMKCGQSTATLIEVPELRGVKSSARALLYQEKIPLARQNELKQFVRNYFELSADTEVSTEMLNEIVSMDITQENDNYVDHGKKVVERYELEFGGHFELQKLWREHFLQSMNPQYLPTMWNVNHNINKNEPSN